MVYNLYVYFHKIGGEILKHVLLRGDNSIFSLFLVAPLAFFSKKKIIGLCCLPGYLSNSNILTPHVMNQTQVHIILNEAS